MSKNDREQSQTLVYFKAQHLQAGSIKKGGYDRSDGQEGIPRDQPGLENILLLTPGRSSSPLLRHRLAEDQGARTRPTARAGKWSLSKKDEERVCGRAEARSRPLAYLSG